MLIYYGNPPLMNILTTKIILDMNEICSTKAMIIMDKINARKQVLDKYSSLDPEISEKIPLPE